MTILKQLREKNRYTQKDLAEKLGISRQAYINYENNVQEPPLEVVKKLSDLFDVSYETLIDSKYPQDPDTTGKSDEERIALIVENFPKLKESEKHAVCEMVRIMASNQFK